MKSTPLHAPDEQPASHTAFDALAARQHVIVAPKPWYRDPGPRRYLNGDLYYPGWLNIGSPDDDPGVKLLGGSPGSAGEHTTLTPIACAGGDRTKPHIRVNFAFFWPGFTPDMFRMFFPFAYEKYDFVLSPDPEVIFYSAFAPGFTPYDDPRSGALASTIRPGKFLRVFLAGENLEPFMEHCDFAMTFSTRTDHPNHLRVPLWVYENRGWGYGPERLLKRPDMDWEEVARAKTEFCNFVYQHEVPHRDAVFALLNEYKRVDAAGRCRNNMNGWTPPTVPDRLEGKLNFLRRYKFTLAIENAIWPGYMTEKLVDPMLVNSIPIYVGDPQAKLSFDPASYVDSTSFSSIPAMIEFVREVDNDRDLYLKMLAAPFYRNNQIPDYARDATVLAFFDRIVEAALARQVRVSASSAARPARRRDWMSRIARALTLSR